MVLGLAICVIGTNTYCRENIVVKLPDTSRDIELVTGMSDRVPLLSEGPNKHQVPRNKNTRWMLVLGAVWPSCRDAVCGAILAVATLAAVINARTMDPLATNADLQVDYSRPISQNGTPLTTSCAIISNGAMTLLDNRTFSPDTYIVRFNEAVVAGHEASVGEWTSMHVFNGGYWFGGGYRRPYDVCKRHVDIAMLAHCPQNAKKRMERKISSAFRVSFGPCYAADWYHEADVLRQEYAEHCRRYTVNGNVTTTGCLAAAGSGVMTMLQLLKHKCREIEMAGWLRVANISGHYYDEQKANPIHEFSMEREVIAYLAREFPHRIIMT